MATKSSGVRTVLLVDDEQDILDAIGTLLETSISNVKVISAISGPQGLDLLKKNAVDLIIADYKMPQMDGMEFLTKARAAYPTIPQVLITAFPKLNLAIQAINDVNVEKFLIKPLNPDEIVKVAEGLLPKV